jgi:hypothetical protein
MKKLIFIILILLLGVAAYYWFFMRPAPAVEEPTNEPVSFNPINRPGTPQKPGTTTSSSTTPTGISTRPNVEIPTKLPRLRQLSSTPVGGFTASTTASSTIVRYIDRGVGHVYEAKSDTGSIVKISNTTIPRVYESYWDKKARAFVARYVKDDAESVVNFSAELRPLSASSTSGDGIRYEVKGRFLAPTIQEIAVSPKADRIFTFVVENGRGTGYFSGFDESKKTKIFEIPFTQVYIDWPLESTATIGTRPSGGSTGYFYQIGEKGGLLKKILGGIYGLSAKMSADGKKVIYSSARGQNLSTFIYNIADGSTQEAIFKTLADKCVWSKKYPSDVYCAVPTEFPRGTYPDDWYRGAMSFVDQIWRLDTLSGDVELVANLFNQSQSLIDATNLMLDSKENFLIFTNKKDLTLWSLELN